MGADTSFGLTIIFEFATATIPSYVIYSGGEISLVVLVALFVTPIPTTIGALLSAIGIAGMNRLVRFNELAMSGRAVEAGLVRMLELIEAEVISCLVLLGVKRYSELTARHLEPITPLPGRLGLASAFPLLSEGY